MKRYYYVPGIDVILEDAGDVFFMVALYDGSASNISRFKGADLLSENGHHEIEQQEFDGLLAQAGIELS